MDCLLPAHIKGRRKPGYNHCSVVELEGIQGAIYRVAKILDMKNEKYDGVDISDSFSDISINDIDLSIDEKDILKDITTKVSRGQKIAIVGSSGSGKTTLLNMLERFYAPNKGEILLGRQRTEEINLCQYRGMFSCVGQDVGLFNETLRFNLCYGLNREVSDEEILNACKAAHLLEFVQLQARYSILH